MRMPILSLLAATALLAVPGEAQNPAPAPAPAPPPGIAPETALRHRERLQLTDEQVRRFQDLRKEALEARRDEMYQMMDLRSRAQAGEISGEELRAERSKRREAIRAQAGARSDRAGAVLNQAQRDKLRELRGPEARRRGWDGARGGRGDRMRPGSPRGGRMGPPGVGRGDRRGPSGPMGPPGGARGRFQRI